jgi:hypothetical protein
MDLDKLEKLANLVLKDLHTASYPSYPILKYPNLEAKFRNLLQVSYSVFPEHKELFTTSANRIYEGANLLSVDGAIYVVNHILQILDIEKSCSSKAEKMKIFESAEEKMKQADLSFQKEDFASTFHCLNTAFELILKDKIGIPTTITKINTSNIVEILVKHKVEPYLYFQEVKKRVIEIDNKIKHQGYSPSKIDAINGIKAMEDLISKLRKKEIELTDEVRNKICEGL